MEERKNEEQNGPIIASSPEEAIEKLTKRLLGGGDKARMTPEQEIQAAKEGLAKRAEEFGVTPLQYLRMRNSIIMNNAARDIKSSLRGHDTKEMTCRITGVGPAKLGPDGRYSAMVHIQIPFGLKDPKQILWYINKIVEAGDNDAVLVFA